MNRAIIFICFALSFLAYPQFSRADYQAFYDYATPTTYTATGTSGQALGLNTSRRVLYIQNKGSDTVFVKFGSVHSGTEGLQVSPGQSLIFEKAPINKVFLKSNSGSQPVTLQEGM